VFDEEEKRLFADEEALKSSVAAREFTLKREEARESSSFLPAPPVVLGNAGKRGRDLDDDEEPLLFLTFLGLLVFLGMINFFGASFKLDPVKLLALRRSLALTLYLRHIHRRESSGSTQWY